MYLLNVHPGHILEGKACMWYELKVQILVYLGQIKDETPPKQHGNLKFSKRALQAVIAHNKCLK